MAETVLTELAEVLREGTEGAEKMAAFLAGVAPVVLLGACAAVATAAELVSREGCSVVEVALAVGTMAVAVGLVLETAVLARTRRLEQHRAAVAARLAEAAREARAEATETATADVRVRELRAAAAQERARLAAPGVLGASAA